ncbi:polysaccharide deacetylase family protein [Pseudomonas sp. 5P_5.1_Bac1]|uniref:polysaccharide deacetylase family protein n=1 Tax=Pseudomonas sp. 5P_5.1_Bac1 TaxID=2971616 RepID=UPI0021C7E853|nr:polysaccharide deacetylase family protein [Pseudomonas sp. 5P_5.1_Bac1]MCU1721003.1 polysaccharide deacetylase family protein [Pseudomonas sp. 5P_5.1_Bac1]
MRIALVALTALLSLVAQAAPLEIATFERSHWPETLDTPVLFDVASRAEILSFARVLSETEVLNEPTLAARLQLRQINLPAISEYRERLWRTLWRNYDMAQQSCEQDASFCYAIENLGDLRQQAAKFAVDADSFYAGWAEPSRQFHNAYLNELLRKAALFPQTASEVMFYDAAEVNGDRLNDRVFLFTFDGGPSMAGASTEQLSVFLRKQKLDGLFFVLGQSVQSRRDKLSLAALREVYRGQCVGVQGWQYRSHAQWKDWEDSVLRSVARVQGDLPAQYVPLFRPPYGQRRADSAGFFASQNLRVTLWDIDAQDLSPLTAEQSAQRTLSLMLLWRRGLIQLHDSQPKAQAVVTWVLTHTAQSGIGWESCRDFAGRQ